MEVTLVKYYYRKSIQGGLVQGIKANRVPSRAMYGGNGSFVLDHVPPKVILLVRSVETLEEFEINIYYQLKKAGKRVSEQLADEVCSKLKDKPFEVSKRLYVGDYGSTYVYDIEDFDNLVG